MSFEHWVSVLLWHFTFWQIIDVASCFIVIIYNLPGSKHQHGKGAQFPFHCAGILTITFWLTPSGGILTKNSKTRQKQTRTHLRTSIWMITGLSWVWNLQFICDNTAFKHKNAINCRVTLGHEEWKGKNIQCRNWIILTFLYVRIYKCIRLCRVCA